MPAQEQREGTAPRPDRLSELLHQAFDQTLDETLPPELVALGKRVARAKRAARSDDR